MRGRHHTKRLASLQRKSSTYAQRSPIESADGGAAEPPNDPDDFTYGLSDLKLQVSFDFTYEQALQRGLTVFRGPALRNAHSRNITSRPIGGDLPLERRKIGRLATGDLILAMPPRRDVERADRRSHRAR